MGTGQLAPSVKQGYSPPEFLVIGTVLKPWGLRGAVKVEVTSDFPRRFLPGNLLYIQGRTYRCESSHSLKSGVILKLQGVDTLDQAKALRGLLLEIPFTEMLPAKEGRYFYFQVIGMEVYTTAGQYLGMVREIMQTGSNDVYVVQGQEGQVLVPATEDVVRAIEPDARKMVIEPIPGLF